MEKKQNDPFCKWSIYWWFTVQNVWWFSEHFCLLSPLIPICWIHLLIFPGMETGLQVCPKVFEAPICQISYWHQEGLAYQKHSPKEAKWISRWAYTEKWMLNEFLRPEVCGFCVTKMASISVVTSDVALNSHWNNIAPFQNQWCDALSC